MNDIVYVITVAQKHSEGFAIVGIYEDKFKAQVKIANLRELADKRIEAIGDADILLLKAIKLQNSETWTLPVASAGWNGR